MKSELTKRTAEASSAEAVILIHGTGAGGEVDRGDKSWQFESHFEKFFSARISPQAFVDKPFHWTGRNSETDRRAAGRALLRCFLALEARGQTYHVVAHSHGGSVLWHALVESARRKTYLQGLKTWTTVGTPFLSFAPNPSGWWQLLGLISAGGALGWLSPLLIDGWSNHEVLLRDVNPIALLGIGLLSAFLASIASYSLFRLGHHLVNLARRAAERAAERQAAEWYRSCWLGLWHNRDEPLAGLRASLVSVIEVVPRLGATSASSIKRILCAPYDWAIAPVADQFVWAATTARAQGADVIGIWMVGAHHAPGALRPGWPALPSPLAEAMVSTANAHAAASAAGMREKFATLADAKDGNDLLRRLVATLSWQDLIHTSYFDHSEIVELIAGHIRESSGAAPSSNHALEHWRRSRPAAPRPVSDGMPRRYPLALAISKGLVAAAFSLLFGVSILASHQAAIAPYTRAYQLDRIAESITQVGIVTFRGSDLLGEVVVRLVALGKAAALDAVPDDDSNRFAHVLLQFGGGPLAFAAGHLDQKGKTDRVLSSIERAGSDLSALYLADTAAATLFLAGSIRAKQPVDHAFVSKLVAEVHSDITSEQSTRNPLRAQPQAAKAEISFRTMRVLADLLPILHLVDRRGDADTFLEILRVDPIFVPADSERCDVVSRLAERAGWWGAVDAVVAIAQVCPGTQYQPYRARVLFYRAALLAYSAGKRKEAWQLFDRATSIRPLTKSESVTWPIVMWRMDTRPTEVSAHIDDLLEEWRRRPHAALDGRVGTLLAHLRKVNLPQLADRVLDTMTSLFREEIEDASIPGRRIPFAREYASLMVSEGRSRDAIALANKLVAKAAKPGTEPKDGLVEAAVMFAAAGDIARARQDLRDGFRESRKMFLPHERIDVSCDIASVAASLNDVKLMREVLSAVEVDILLETSYEDRAESFAAIAPRLVFAADLRRARMMAERAGDPKRVLRAYAAILDAVLIQDNEQAWISWGLNERNWQPTLKRTDWTSAFQIGCKYVQGR